MNLPGTSLISNVSPTGGSAGQILTITSSGSMWTTPKYVDDHLEAAGGVPVYRQQELRNQHPALQEAWEAYLAMLYICDDK